MINGVILRKLQVLDETISELRSLGMISAQQLTDILHLGTSLAFSNRKKAKFNAVQSIIG